MKYETKVLTDKTREDLGGFFVEISDGFVHYELKGPENAPLVILIHGFSMPMFLWDPTFNALLDAGFRVLRYDLFGRGYSDRPRKKYNHTLYIKQLHELLIKLKLNDIKACLVGLSMGGLISVLYSNSYPNIVRKISLIDPAGFPYNNKQNFILKVPILKNIAFNLLGHKILIERVPDNFYKPEKYPNFTEKFTEQLEYKGYLRAILSTINSFPFSDFGYAYEELGRRNIPVQLFWGEYDKILPYSNSEKILSAIHRTEFHKIPDSGHLCHYEQRDIVNSKLIDFLK